MSQPSNESQLLRGAFVPTLVVSLLAIAISTVVQGISGFWGALLAQFVVIIFFVIHIAVSRLTRNLDPISTMAMALFSYFAKLFALGLLLWAISKYTDRATINRIAFGITAVALTIAWLWGEIASYMKLRLHLPLPTPEKPASE
jgi:fructose-specific phosphotransferase system IIC component